jgi:flagellar biosynthesis component FlhA
MPQQKEIEEEKEEENKEAETKIVEIEKFDEKKFIDYNKMACLLCKRGFDSVELLNKHVQMSALHKVREINEKVFSEQLVFSF